MDCAQRILDHVNAPKLCCSDHRFNRRAERCSARQDGPRDPIWESPTDVEHFQKCRRLLERSADGSSTRSKQPSKTV